jgi:hypothetical protein
MASKENPIQLMSWRYVSYTEGSSYIHLMIEPMVDEPDLLYVPKEEIWNSSAPDWAKNRKKEIINKILGFGWKRDLVEVEINTEVLSMDTLFKPVPGSILSTEGGEKLESLNLFHPKMPLTKDKEMIRKIWYEAEKKFAEAVKGEIRLFLDDVFQSNSVFNRITIPILKTNPNAKMIFYKKGSPNLN